MSNKKYEFDNRKPGMLSKIGSTAIAVGSVATAITIAMPSAGSFFVQATQQAATALGVDSVAGQASEQQLTGNVSGQTAGLSTATPIESANSDTYQMSIDASGSSLPTAMASPTANGVQDRTEFPPGAPSPTATSIESTTSSPLPTATSIESTTSSPLPTATSTAPLALSPISSGNVSSATPTASGNTSSGSPTANQGSSNTATAGNLSSATPLGSSGSGHEDDDDHDDDHEDDHDDDHEDDHDDDHD